MATYSTTFKQGDTYYNPQTGKADGTVQYDANTGAKLSSGQTTTQTTITSDALNSTNTPYKLPSTSPTSTATYGGLQGATEAITTQAKSAEEMARDEAKKAYDTSSADLLKGILDMGNISSSVDREEQDAAKKDSDNYTSQLEQEQLAIRRQIESLQNNNPTGKLSGGVAIEADRLNRQSLSKQADIAILLTSANRRYDTASAIADRQVAMKLEQSTAKLAALQFFYQNNKDTFNKLDDRLYQEVLAKKQAELKRQTEVENAIKELKLNVAQYAGSSAAGILAQLSAIDSTQPGAFDRAVQIAGKYASDPLDRQIKQAQLAKLTAPTGIEAPTIKTINGVDYQWNGSAWVTPTGVSGTANQSKIATLQDKIANIDSLINHSGLNSAVGTNFFGRTALLDKFSGAKQTFIAGVQQLVSGDTLDTLIELKKAGGTLGALSDQERIMLQSAASKIGTWAITNDKGKVTGYDTSESSFIKELETIKMLTQRALSEAGGGGIEEYYLDTIDAVLQSTNNDYQLYLNP